MLRDTGGGFYVTSFENLGASQAVGAELAANGRLTPKLRYNLNGDLYWNQIDAGPVPGSGGRRSVFGVGGRANLDWQADTDDLFQLNAAVQGRRVLAQGTQGGVFTLNLGWRRKLGDRLTATLTAQDILKTARFQRELNTATLRDVTIGRSNSRAIVLRLDLPIGRRGGRPAREPPFDYEAAPAQ